MVVKRQSVKRDFRHGLREESAVKCIGKIEKGCEIFGLTKGQFSMIDIIKHCLNQVGAADVSIGTWTAAHSDVKQAYTFLKNKKLKSLRFLVDRSFPTRQPKYYEALIKSFGEDSVRFANFHAKFVLIKNERFNLCVRTSMNLNLNSRIENFEISDSLEMYNYLEQIVNHHFDHPPAKNGELFKSFKVD